MDIVGIVPARGESKRLARKNALTIGGRTLIQRVADAASESKLLSRVVVSTDDDEITRQAMDADLNVNLRPVEFRTYKTRTWQIVQHILNDVAPDADIAVMLLPTVPFRTGATIDRTIEALIEAGDKRFWGDPSHIKMTPQSYIHRWHRTSAFTVKDADYPADWQFVKNENGHYVRYNQSGLKSREDSPSYIHDGSVWATWADYARVTPNFTDDDSPRIGVMQTDEREALDIDWQWQLDLARLWAGEYVREQAPEMVGVPS